MIQLTFYKGVPFSTENKDVLFISESERQLFLQDYEINAVPIQIDKFAVNGTDDNSIIDVTLEQEPFDTNYLKVVQELDALSERTIYYFVNSVQTVAPNTFRLNLTVDIWNTYFLKTNATSTDYEIPLMKNALCIAGHGFENGGEAEEINQPNICSSIPTYTPFHEFSYFYIAFQYTSSAGTTMSPQGILFDRYVRRYEDALGQAMKIMSTTKVWEKSSSTTFERGTITFQRCFLIPTYLLPNFERIVMDERTSAITKFFVGNTAEQLVTEIVPITCIYTGFGGYSTNFNFTFEKNINGEYGKYTTIGTLNHQIEVPKNNKTLIANVETNLGESISMLLTFGNQQIDILSDFEISAILNESSYYFTAHEQTLQMKNITQSISIASSLAGLGVSALSGNAIGAIGSGFGIIKSISNSLSQNAQLSDISKQPFRTINSSSNQANIFQFYGIGIRVWTPLNYDDIIAYDNYFGYKFDGFYDTLSIDALSETDRFRFLQCSEINLIGKFTMSVKNALESLFKRGLRIWYHKEHYLDSQAQQIDEEQGV